MGNPIEYLDGIGWVLSSTKEPLTDEIESNLICPKCNKISTIDGHDPCIANLPSVEFACCGHGIDSMQQAYIKYNDGTVIRFDTTDDIQKYVKKKD